MLRTAAFEAFDTAQQQGKVSAEEIARLKQWYDELEKEQKFSGLFSIGNPISKLQDETGLVGLAALGMTGYGALEGLGMFDGGLSASGGGTASGGIPTIPADATLFGEIPGAGASVGGGWSIPADASLFGETGFGSTSTAHLPQIPIDSTLFGETPGAGAFVSPSASGGASSLLSGANSLVSGAKDLFGDFMPSGNFLNTAAATAPILAAINYAKNQGPFDTSRLTSTYDEFSPEALAYEYDQNTGAGRRALTSSLTNRGVMGSSFGNMDLTNFQTSRDLGRRSLVNQGLAQRGNIAATLLDAQVKERGLKNDLYGRSLLALGNVFGGRNQSPVIA